MDPNVLLLVLDSVRARNLSLYGHVNGTTPFLEEFANTTTVYTNARAPSIGSRPSHASLFTGYHAAETGVSSEHKLRPGTTIWENLRDDGYDTAVFSDNPFLRSNRYGFIHGFETVKTRPADYVDVPFPSGLDSRMEASANDVLSGIASALRDDTPVRSLVNGATVLLSKRSAFLGRQLGQYHDTVAGTYVDAFGEWLDGRDGPWAACLNLMDAHYPYEPAAEFDHWGSPVLRELQDEWGTSNYAKAAFHEGDRPWWQLGAFESLYDGSIRQLDAAIATTVTLLEEAGILDETLLVITSDHGEGFGERSYFDPDHRLVAHGAEGGIHDAKAHVPLLIKYPGQDLGRRVESPASLTAFPHVVRAVRDGYWRHDEFVPDGPVLVTLDAGYEESAVAVYDERSGIVRMQTVCGPDAATVEIRDSQTKHKESERVSETTWEMSASLEDRDISVLQEAGDVDQETHEHLADLGYV